MRVALYDAVPTPSQIARLRSVLLQGTVLCRVLQTQDWVIPCFIALAWPEPSSGHSRIALGALPSEIGSAYQGFTIHHGARYGDNGNGVIDHPTESRTRTRKFGVLISEDE
jgi:hypothetical protein